MAPDKTLLFFFIFASCDFRSTSVVMSNAPVIRYDKLQPDEVKEVLLCLMYVLKHADEEALIAWWHNASQHDLICFFHILELSLRQFKYMGRKRFGVIGDGSSSKSSTLPPRVPPPVFGSRPSTCYEPDSGNNVFIVNSLSRVSNMTFKNQDHALMEIARTGLYWNPI